MRAAFWAAFSSDEATGEPGAPLHESASEPALLGPSSPYNALGTPAVCTSNYLWGRRLVLAREAERNLYSWWSISTRRPRKITPSDCRRKRCSKPELPPSLISPLAPRTRCHGRSRAVRNTAATCRAPWGKPAARAIAPYVETMPRGICRMAAAIFALRCTDSELVCKFLISSLI
jgi:hypothetical protein